MMGVLLLWRRRRQGPQSQRGRDHRAEKGNIKITGPEREGGQDLRREGTGEITNDHESTGGQDPGVEGGGLDRGRGLNPEKGGGDDPDRGTSLTNTRNTRRGQEADHDLNKTDKQIKKCVVQE